jgi:hypothetical protein
LRIYATQKTTNRNQAIILNLPNFMENLLDIIKYVNNLTLGKTLLIKKDSDHYSIELNHSIRDGEILDKELMELAMASSNPKAVLQMTV